MELISGSVKCTFLRVGSSARQLGLKGDVFQGGCGGGCLDDVLDKLDRSVIGLGGQEELGELVDDAEELGGVGRFTFFTKVRSHFAEELLHGTSKYLHVFYLLASVLVEGSQGKNELLVDFPAVLLVALSLPEFRLNQLHLLCHVFDLKYDSIHGDLRRAVAVRHLGRFKVKERSVVLGDQRGEVMDQGYSTLGARLSNALEALKAEAVARQVSISVQNASHLEDKLENVA